MFLLDTNVCVQYLRGKNVLIRQQLPSHPTHEMSLCSVVLAELYYGVLRSAKPAKNRADVDQFAAPFRSLPFDQAAADIFAGIRHHLETLGLQLVRMIFKSPPSLWLMAARS